MPTKTSSLMVAAALSLPIAHAAQKSSESAPFDEAVESLLKSARQDALLFAGWTEGEGKASIIHDPKKPTGPGKEKASPGSDEVVMA